MDEPLSNLDAQLRLQMRAEIKRLQRELGATTLYVTHDQVEAMTMADTVAVMSRGRLQQLASPAELYARPANLFVAGFCGSPPMNILAGAITDGVFVHPAGSVPVAAAANRGDVKLGFRPEHASVVEPGTQAAFGGEVYVVEPLGNETLVAVEVGGTVVNIRAPAEFTAADRPALRRAAGPAAPAPLRHGDGRIPRHPPLESRSPSRGIDGRNDSKEERMTDTPVTTADPLERPLTRREVIKRGAVGRHRDRLRQQPRVRAQACGGRRNGGLDHDRHVPGQRPVPDPRLLQRALHERDGDQGQVPRDELQRVVRRTRRTTA